MRVDEEANTKTPRCVGRYKQTPYEKHAAEPNSWSRSFILDPDQPYNSNIGTVLSSIKECLDRIGKQWNLILTKQPPTNFK